MLALWEYFWDTVDWVPGTATSTAVVSLTVSSAGSGKWRDHKRIFRDVERLPEDYWEVRERYLRRLLAADTFTAPRVTKPSIVIPITAKLAITPTVQQTKDIYAKRLRIIEAARYAATRAELLYLGADILAITLAIKEQELRELELLLQAAVLASSL